jgi:hypothetical protein
MDPSSHQNGIELHLNTVAPLGLKLQRYQLSDIPEMVDATEEFCRGHPFYSGVPFSRRKLATLLEDNIDNKKMFCELVWKGGDRIAGMAGMVSGYAMSEERFTQDIFHFVKEEYRGSVAFPMLIGAYIQWSQSMGAWNAVLSYTGEKVAPLTRILKKWGFEHFGETYTKSLT